MNIKSNYWNSFKNYIKRAKQFAFDTLPNATFNDNGKKDEFVKKIDDRISRPAENRAIMGATALVTQPTIDYYNHRVDDDTRTVSRNRTIAKVLIGTCVGIPVRGISYNIIEKMTQLDGTNKYSRKLLPEKHLSSLIQNPQHMKNYRSALATATALFVMCFTNFLIDAPLTAMLTNKLNEKTKEKRLAHPKEEIYA